MLKMPKRCIYCGDTERTLEHVFGNWLRKVIPDRHQHGFHQTVRYSTIQGEKIATFREGAAARPGSNLSRKIRLVCSSCNNVWMSKIQNEARPYLIELISGSWDSLDTEVAVKISTWATMVTINLEFLDLRTAGITNEQRNSFYENKMPFENTQVFIGRYQGTEDDGAFYHSCLGTADRSALAQVSSINLGKLNIVVFTATHSSFLPPIAGLGMVMNLNRIWPLPVNPTSPTNFIQGPQDVFNAWMAFRNAGVT